MRVGIAGLGLIGGSLALALGGRHEVAGWDADPAALAAARARGIAVVASREELAPADVIVVATPFASVVPTLEALAPAAAGAVLMDVGSLKRPIAAYAERAPANARIVGGHPMAGSTGTGLEAAVAALFAGRPFLLVPTARSDDAAMAAAGDLARAVGAVPTACSAEAHDRMVATLAGLPLAVAIALARTGADVARFAGPGYRDATRLADTPPALADVLLRMNADGVRAALARFREALDEVERGLG